MQHFKVSVIKVCVMIVGLAPMVAARTARADEPPVEAPQENPIPPNAEGQALPSQNGGYCFGGPHPAPGGGWEAMTTPHVHDYAPFDLRLFAYHDGCYYFVGDPRDFGYTGETFSYYGAHPIADNYGGGWCFMIGAHSHWWRPWSPYFTTVGSWYYWNGPYDPFFWSYWPYYSFYYRSYYPSYYSGGRYYRTWRAAPGISRVPPTTWRGSPGGGGAWRGAPGGAARVGQPYGSAPGAGAWRGAPAGGSAWRASPQSSGGGWRGSPVPNTSPLRSSPGGGWHPSPSGGGGWHPAPSGGGGWHGAPSGGGFHGGGGGGGFHSGGGFHGGRR